MVIALGFVGVNAFGAWAVSRRRPYVARLFLLAATVLVVAAVALGYHLWAAAWILVAGLLLWWWASYLNAAWVLGRVVPRHHVLRAVSVVAVMALTVLALR